jgi:tetratricopeptide (TPR) repeat protein
VALLELGDIEGVDRQIEEYAAIAEELKQPYQLWFAEVFRAMIAGLRGNLADAEAIGQRALELGSSQQGENAVQFFAAQLMTNREHQGRLGEMEPALRAYAEQFPDILAIRGALAMTYAIEGRFDDARAQLDIGAANDFTDLPRDTTWLLSLTMFTHAATALGDARRAKLLYDLFLPYDSRTIVAGPAIVCHGSAAHYLGVLAATIGRRDDAARHFSEAIEMHERMGALPYLAHSLREYASLLASSHATDDQQRAKEMLQRASTMYEFLGMTVYAETTRALLGAVGRESGRAG